MNEFHKNTESKLLLTKGQPKVMGGTLYACEYPLIKNLNIKFNNMLQLHNFYILDTVSKLFSKTSEL